MADTASKAASDAAQSQADANVTADIDTSEAFKQGVYGNAQSWAYNTKKLADAYTELDLRSAKEYADIAFARARASQETHESLVGELQKDLAEIRGRRMNQFDFAVNKQWNINETDQLAAKTAVQQDVTASALIGKLIDGLTELQGELAKKAA